MDLEKQTTEVIRRYREAFQKNDPEPFDELVATDCVLENTGPAPDGERYEGHKAVVAFWRSIASDPTLQFEEEEVFITGDRAVIRWRLKWGKTNEESVRGVNLMWVRDNKIVKAMGYIKA